MFFTKFFLQLIYYSLYDLLKIFVNFRKEFNFIIIYPRIISIILKHVLIFEKKNNKFFFQYIRNYSDILTVYEIFSEENYNLKKFKIFKYIKKYLDENEKNRQSLILDCGSNIGSSSNYFSKLFNKSKIISIEPDNKNFFFSKKNIIKNKSELMNCAVSNENEKLRFISDKKDGRASKINDKGDVKISCLSIANILMNFSKEKYFPFLIKIDIEGHEKKLFESNYEWINDFKIILIELHDWMLPNKYNSFTFFNSINQIMNKYKKRDFIISGENLISIRIDEK